MDVNGVNASQINWAELLGKLGEVTKTTTADGKDALTITVRSGDETCECTLSVPDDLDLPAEVNQESIKSLLDKLQASGLNFTPEQIATFKDAVSQAYLAAAEAVSKSGSVSGKPSKSTSVMFDLYAIMALLVEVAQKQRNATRDLRSAQSAAIQKSIQDQADQQRFAAVLGLAVGVACGIASMLISAGMMFAQSRAFGQQQSIAKNSGLEASNTKVSMLKNMDTVAHANKQFDTVKASVGNEVAGRVEADFGNQLVDAEKGDLRQNVATAQAKVNTVEAKVADKQNALNAAQQELDVKTAELDTAKNTLNSKKTEVGLQEKQQAYDNAVRERDTQVNNLGKENPAVAEYETRVNEAKASLDEAKSLLEPFEAAVNTAQNGVDTALAKVNTCQNDVNLANAELTTAKAELTAAKNDYVKTVTDVGEQYAEKYKSAVERAANPEEGANVAELKDAVNVAEKEMKMARAYEAKCLAPNDIMSPSEQKDLISVARAQADSANARVAERADYKEAAYTMQKYIGINGIVQAMGSTLQTMAQQLSQIEAADATKRGAEQQRLQEQLDQTKDLFQQDQELINSVVQLMQAIVSAETQSMHDAIQA